MKKTKRSHSVKKTKKRSKSAKTPLSIETDLYLLGEYRKTKPKELDKLNDAGQKERKELLKRLSPEDLKRLKRIGNTSMIAKYKISKKKLILHSVYSPKLGEAHSAKALSEAFDSADQEQCAKAKSAPQPDLEKKMLKLLQDLEKEEEPYISSHAILLKQLVDHYAQVSKRSTAEIYAFLENYPKTSMESIRRKLINGDFLI